MHGIGSYYNIYLGKRNPRLENKTALGLQVSKRPIPKMDFMPQIHPTIPGIRPLIAGS